MMNRFFGLIILAIASFAFVACNSDSTPKKLPYLGMAEEGEFYTIPPYAFLDQEGGEITEKFVEGKIHVVDFFFTSCPDICPKMNQQMLKVHDKFLDDEGVFILSHTLDPKRDTVEVLHDFAKGLGINNNKWKMLVSPDPDYVFEVCKSYMIAAGPDESILGGIFHSGKFVLIDTKGRVRGFYEGTDEEEVDKLIDDILMLKNEKES